MTEVIEAARALAWWTHVNLSSPTLYRARQESFGRLRRVLAEHPQPTPFTFEEAAVWECAIELAECSDSNRCGEPYYTRKAAFARLRGALAAYDGMLPTQAAA